MADEPQNPRQIFSEALEKQTPEERRRYLDEVCGSNVDLRCRLEALLRAHEQAGDFLEAPALGGDETLDISPLCEGPGTIIGRYKLLEKIGEGGMAVVYMAEQEQPVRRKVALKIIKLGMDTKNVIARFEAERQALALMDHPNVAKIFDGGTTETGRPYFVMELVRGVSITDYCDTNRLSPRERLELFAQVCQAVQHAHTKGIIHRDLKPSNVMVTLHDSQPVPKIIDFGIAKATNQRLTEKTLFTRYAQIIGTPEYMSPEQAQMSGLDVDIRTDIYSLGVLLYELLTGTTPFGEPELRRAGYLEMQRVIREQEPVKPSTKLSTLGETLTGIAKCRNSTPELLRRAIRGDLDWIVMKSLEKDRVRRYETASGLAEDIRRHLEHEPILARSPSATYRLHKFLRKHRAGVLAAIAVVVVAAAVGVVLSLWNRDRLRLEETQGVRDQGILSQARGQYASANREAALQMIKPILHSRHVGGEAQLLQASLLVDIGRSDEAVALLNALFNERPEIAGAAHSLMARILWEGESLNTEALKQIEEHRRQAEALLPETAEAYFLCAMTAVTVKEQLAALDRALRLDPSHYESRRLRAFTYYASRKYERMNEDAAILETLRNHDPLGYSLRAAALRELKRYQEAIEDYDTALALTSRDSPQYVDLSLQRCETFLRMGDYEHVMAEAQAYLKRWPDKLVFQHYLFGALTALGDYDAAREVFRQIVRSGPESRARLEDWCVKYVFDTLEAGRSWHPADREPAGAAFLPMVEAEETYRRLSAKAHRVTTDGFTARWSPDGKKLAYSMGVRGYNGVALFDPATKETDLLIAPGKDPAWSPDGRYLAFVRDRRALRLEEFAATERQRELRPPPDEEVWLMKADGTEPRFLARGHWPSWSPDSACVYYYSSWPEQVLYSIWLTDPHAQPKRIVACSSDSFPTLSPDGQRVVCLEGSSLKVKDVASQTVVADWQGPFAWWAGGMAWSPRGDEVCMGGASTTEKRAGLWICRFDQREPAKILAGQVDVGSWSPDGTKLVFTLGAPFFEVWATDLDPKVSIIEALGPAQTVEEHWRELIALWTRKIAADPTHSDNYDARAANYRSAHEEAKARADMRRCWAALHPGFPADFRFAGPWSIMHTINGPLDYQLVAFLERQEDGLQLLRIAFGRRGRGQMKLFEIPMIVTSLVGLCFPAGPDRPTARAGFYFGERQNLGPPINTVLDEAGVTLSMDGLELYFCRIPRGGDWDIWVSRRQSVNDPWGPPSNLGAPVNSPYQEAWPSLSSDGLTLYFSDVSPGTPRPGGLGGADIWMSTRSSRAAPWGTPVNMGAPINSPANDCSPCLSRDGLIFVFGSGRAGGYGGSDLWTCTRPTVQDPWGAPVNLGPNVNSGYLDYGPVLSADGLALFFTSRRPGGYGDYDVWVTTRKSTTAPWGPAINAGPVVNTAAWELPGGLSGDMKTFYFFASDRPSGRGNWDVWQVPILRIVDFNGDGKVDATDLTLPANNRDKPLGR